MYLFSSELKTCLKIIDFEEKKIVDKKSNLKVFYSISSAGNCLETVVINI